MKRYLLSCLLALTCLNFTYAQDRNAMKDSIDDMLRKGYYYKNKIRLQPAVNSGQQAVYIANALDDDNYRIASFNFVALLYIEFNDFESADFYLKRSESLLNYTEYDYGLIISKGLRAMMLAENKKYLDAINTIREGRKELNSKNEKLQNLANYYEAIVHFERKDYEKAKALFEGLTPINHAYERNYIKANIKTYLSKIHKEDSNSDEAKTNAIEALKIANMLDFPGIKMINNEILADLYKESDNFQKALFHQEKLSDINAIISRNQQSEAKNAYVDENIVAFQRRMISQMEKDNIEQQQQVNMSKLTSVLSSALLIIISLLTISLYRNNQIKFKTNDLLLKKNLELENARDEAEKAMQAKAQFLSTVSHELRTPLYAVTGLTHLLLEENPSESQKEHLKSLKFSGEYLLNFINDILQINKIEAKKLSLQKIPFLLEKVLKDVVDSLHQTAKENENEIILTIDKRLPKELIGDPLKLSQILINLIGNACKFTEKGAINVMANYVERNDEGVLVQFKVKDDGIGISDEQQSTIFESFAQGSIQINRKYGGTGLGLTIVKSLLGLFNSEIKLESKLGSGSTFMFDISFETVTKQEEEETIVENKLTVEDDFFKDLHLLIVEDNKINQVITKKMLVKKGMTCDIANDGYEAIEKAKSPIYNAILMDIHMPGISGLVTTKEIRKFNSKVPIIALTAMSLDETTDDLFDAGCNDVITKPFKPEVFYKKIGSNILRNIEVNI